MASFTIRAYDSRDAAGWLRCRLLSFFSTQYYDDVVVVRPGYSGPAVELVAVAAGGHDVVGLMDVELDGASATIEVIAVHPDHARRGVATALLDHALPQLRAAGVTTLDAWTREDEPANRWYRSRGFQERYRYLHVHKEWDDDPAGFTAPPGLSAPIRVFSHAPLERKAELAGRYRRIYECRQYVRDVGSS